ncbi:alpha/beta hydrolase [Methylopila musalis]|uniref:Alpha/beta hydrolase n=1 Tax=Methylopila musalis TaxID=1134781 RepID=A0ABW3ZAR3_9HYPH
MTPPFRRLLSLAVASVLGLAAWPAVAGVVQRDLTAPSPALGKPIRYSLYRPAATPAPGQRWPVLYLLHGGGPGEADWLDAGGLASAMDEAIAEGRMPPTVVVMPQAGDSWYVDNTDIGGAGAMETALTRDLVAAIDARLPTAACREGRAVAGLSMGGYGALLFAFDKPGKFASAISLSGSITQPIAPQMTQRLKRARTFYDGAFGTPFDVKRFNRWNLFTKVRQLALRRHKPDVYLNAGDRDPGGIVQGTTEMHLALLRAGVDSTMTVAPGRHEWSLWRRELGPALVWLGARIDPTCGASGQAAAHTRSTQ